ncbi:hypothetical protein [Deinococcus ruber]|uniref:Uncharacterized protein n=1 Tax=Deinococcus ruber TaxID=1848197 RepID=A0A918CCA3_9DEIO|nr:hypothetical protein [Deinococcus ruber]GGR15438.1 hypothetical protein GCM10008957_30220 [Deinococcus ruber]
MFSITQSTTVTVVALWISIGVGLLFGLSPQIIVGLVLLSFVLVMAASHVTFKRHSRRQDALLAGISSTVSETGVRQAVLSLDVAGLSPLVLDQDALLTAIVRAESVQYQAWRFTFQRLLPVNGGAIRLAMLTNGDTTVLNFRAKEGPGYRILLPTEDLEVIRRLLTARRHPAPVTGVQAGLTT